MMMIHIFPQLCSLALCLVLQLARSSRVVASPAQLLVLNRVRHVSLAQLAGILFGFQLVPTSSNLFLRKDSLV